MLQVSEEWRLVLIILSQRFSTQSRCCRSSILKEELVYTYPEHQSIMITILSRNIVTK